jgi:hypothetical protein
VAHAKKVEEAGMSHDAERKFPSFLGIGAARAGTTWLHANIKRHPQIWLPPLKELHYFDLQRPGAAEHYPIRETDVHFLGRTWKLGPRSIRRLFYYRHLSTLCRKRTRLGWSLRYALGFRSDRWYTRLFRTDCVSGEITPGYMLLPRPVVEDVRRLNPDMKIILLLRNPVSRAWSLVRQHLGKRTQNASDETILRLADADWIVKRGDYVNAINTWRGVFGEKQVFIGFFDDLIAAPRDLLRSILNFLEVDSGDERIPKNLERVVNAGAKRELPANLLPHLYATYLDQLRELEKMLGGPVAKWRAKAEEAVAREAVPV